MHLDGCEPEAGHRLIDVRHPELVDEDVRRGVVREGDHEHREVVQGERRLPIPKPLRDATAANLVEGPRNRPLSGLSAPVSKRLKAQSESES